VKGTSINVIAAPEFGKWSEDGGIRVMEDMLAKHKQIEPCSVLRERCDVPGGPEGDRRREALERDHDIQHRRSEGRAGPDHEGHQLCGDRPQLGGDPCQDRVCPAILAGAVPEQDTATPVVVITKENVASYYNPKSIF
jgi:ribose transport system substrate-binding protein